MIELLGKGAFGQVWKCVNLIEDKDKDKNYFLSKKLIPFEEISTKQEDLFFDDYDETVYGMIEREFDIPNILSDCLNIIRVYKLGFSEKDVHIDMEYVEGGDLEQFIANKKFALNYEDKQKLASQLISAFSYMQKRSVIHRDIKPKNILIDTKNKDLIPKICDFGVSKIIDGNPDDGLVGTKNFMAPEILRLYKGDEKNKELVKESHVTIRKEILTTFSHLFKSDVF